MGLTELATTVGTRFSGNLSTSVSSLSAQQWIRLIAIAGAYLLLRPYIIKLGGKLQMKRHEEEGRETEEEEAAAALSASDFRDPPKKKAVSTGVEIPDSDEDSEGDDGTAAPADWGRKARRRQRKMLRTLLEAHEQKLADEQADEEDKDIEEFLVD